MSDTATHADEAAVIRAWLTERSGRPGHDHPHPSPTIREAEMTALKPHERPCVRCPWARTTPPGEFPLERYELLRDTVGAPGREVPHCGPLFACHKTPEGREQPCAGWLAAVGREHIGVRLAVATGRLDPAVLDPKPDWPPLFTDYDELVATQAARATGETIR